VTLRRPALALAAFTLLTPAAALADSAKISDLIDDLQRVQVKIAQGDKAAYPAELNQLKTIGAAIATASPETWESKREADSLVIYILSGGSLADVTPLLKGDTVIESERPLARGALAYVTNHEADAIGLLEQTNLTAFDPRLAGEVAFARSVLETKRDATAAVELLDWSRLLAPGGLVEEAALRREIALLAEAKDATRLAMLTRQYVTRFAASLYAADFLRDLAGAVARMRLADDPANADVMFRLGVLGLQCAAYGDALAWLDRAIALAPRESRYQFARGHFLPTGLAEIREESGIDAVVLQRNNFVDREISVTGRHQGRQQRSMRIDRARSVTNWRRRGCSRRLCQGNPMRRPCARRYQRE